MRQAESSTGTVQQWKISCETFKMSDALSNAQSTVSLPRHEKITKTNLKLYLLLSQKKLSLCHTSFCNLSNLQYEYIIITN